MLPRLVHAPNVGDAVDKKRWPDLHLKKEYEAIENPFHDFQDVLWKIAYILNANILSAQAQ